MKRKILAVVICLSMLFSSQAFAMGIPEERDISEPAQEISTDETPAKENSTDVDPTKESSTDTDPTKESSTDVDPTKESSTDETSAEESSTDVDPTKESSTDETPAEESSTDVDPTKDDHEKNYTILSDGKGTSFILVDENYIPAEKDAKVSGAAVYKSTSTDTSYVIPNEVADSETGKTWPVIAFYEYALANNDSFQNVQIPDSVKVIGKGAFSSCKKLAEITIPAGVETIGEAAFKDCTSLKTIHFSGKPEVAANAFDGVEATAYCPLSWAEIPASGDFGGNIKWVVTIPKLSNLKAVSASYNSAKISWSKLSGADGYIVYRKDNGSWKRLSVITASSYTDKKLVCGQSYTYTVRAYKLVNGKEVKGDYNKKGVTAKILPAATKLVEATANSSSIQITWSKVSGANGYRVYRLNPETGKWKGIKNVDSSVTSYTDKGLNAGQYTYTVRAYRTVSGEKIYGGYDKKGISAYITPAAPKLTSVSGSVKSITVQWGTIAGADGYRVYRKTGTSGTWQKLKDIADGTASSYKDTTATEGTYIYTVRAYIQANGKNIFGSYQKKGISATIPAQPKLVSAVASKSKNQSMITVKWEAVPKADGYRVYRKVNDSGWKLLTTQKSNTLSVVDKKVSSGVVYTYTVRAYTNAGSSQILSTYDKKGVKAVGYMEAPALELIASWYDDYSAMADLLLFWTETENADGYIIYYKEAGNSGWTRLKKIDKDDDEIIFDEEEHTYADIIEEVDMSTEYLFTVRPYKIVDGKEVKGAYNKKGISTEDAIDLEDILDDIEYE